MTSFGRLETKLEVYTTEQLKTLVRTMADCPKRRVAQFILATRKNDSKANATEPIDCQLSIVSICNIDLRNISQTRMEAITAFLQTCSNTDIVSVSKKAKSKAVRKAAKRVYAVKNPPRSRPRQNAVTYNTILNAIPSSRPKSSTLAPVPAKCQPNIIKPKYVKKQCIAFRIKLDEMTEPAPLTELERTYQMPDESNRPRWS